MWAQKLVEWADRLWNAGDYSDIAQVPTPTSIWKKGVFPSDTRSIGVWWDIENCAVPKSASIDTIGDSIRETLHNLQLNGRFVIRAFGAMANLPPGTVLRLSRTGVVLKHVPGGKNTFETYPCIMNAATRDVLSKLKSRCSVQCYMRILISSVALRLRHALFDNRDTLISDACIVLMNLCLSIVQAHVNLFHHLMCLHLGQWTLVGVSIFFVLAKKVLGPP